MRQGSCLCGAVQYRVTVPIEHIGLCHCSMCRKHSGGLGLTAEIAPGGIDWTGDDNIQTYRSSDWAERGFCKRCGSSLFWRMTAPGPAQGMISLSAGTLDDLNGLPLTTEIYIDHKPDSYAVAGDTIKMTQAEVEAAYAYEAGDET